MEVSGNHPVVMDDHVSIETHGDLGITHFQNPPYIHIHVCIALHCITLHYIALHYTTLHYITLHYITLHCTTLHRTTLHYITLHYIMYIYNYIIISYHISYILYTHPTATPPPQRRSDPAPCRSRSPPSPQRLPWPSPQSWPSTPSSRLPERNIVQQDPGDMTWCSNKVRLQEDTI